MSETFRATAVVTLDEMDHVLTTLLDHFEEHATVIRSATGARLTSPFATVDIACQPEAVLLEVTCGSAEILAMIKVFVAAVDGRMVWPRGEDQLVTHVYTIRSVDADRSRIAGDFVLHEGKHLPGASFTLHAAPGNVIGILGPGGDGCPDAPRLLLIGDEAALPAISRMIESLASGCMADVVVEVEDEGIAGGGAMGMAAPAGCLCRRLGSAGKSSGRAARRQRSRRQLHLGRLRARLPDRKGSHRIYGYWTADPGGSALRRLISRRTQSALASVVAYGSDL